MPSALVLFHCFFLTQTGTETTYEDFMGEENTVHWPKDKVPHFIFQNHGEAFYLFNQALQHGTCPPEGVTVLHVDNHDDLGFPPLPLENLKTQNCRQLDTDGDCPVNNHNFMLASHIVTGGIKRILWLYPEYSEEANSGLNKRGVQSCLIGHARKLQPNGRQYYETRLVGAERWGLSEEYEPYTCSSSPNWDVEGQTQYFPGNQATFPLDDYVEFPQRGYEYSMLLADAALEEKWWTRILGNATWFSQPREASQASAWVLDFDLDFLIYPNETGSRAEKATSMDEALFEQGKEMLCPLTKYCDDILYEFRHQRPAAKFQPRDVLRRLRPVEALLRRMLPSRPCLVTIARSNEGAFTPLQATMVVEKAVLEMLESLYGPDLNVQYLKSAFGSRKQSYEIHQRLYELVHARFSKVEL